MSHSYVKYFEGSVVWNISKLPHEGILKAILSVYSSLLTERVCESGPRPLHRDVWIPLEEDRRAGELPQSDGAGHGPAVLCRPGPALTLVRWGDSQLLGK